MAELQVVYEGIEENDLLRNLDEDLNYALNYCFQDANVQQGTSVMVSRNLPYAEQMWVQNDRHSAIQDLFIEYNMKYFYGLLQDVEVECCEFLTGCVGSCSFQGPDDHCTIHLNWHLLKHRPHCDLEETLLHEMIHAYLFVTGVKEDRERHGPEFVKNMARINKEAGTSISIYHSFTDGPDLSRPHWWKCNGVCKKWHPFYGSVKRAIDRTPGSDDIWWTAHNYYCKGQFKKVEHPDFPEKRASKRKNESENTDGKKKSSPEIIVKFTQRKSKSFAQKCPKLPHSENTDGNKKNIPEIIVKLTERKSKSFVQKYPKLPHSENTDGSEPNIPKVVMKLIPRKSMSPVEKHPILTRSENTDGKKKNSPEIIVKFTQRKSNSFVQKNPNIQHSENTDGSEPNIPEIIMKLPLRNPVSPVQKQPVPSPRSENTDGNKKNIPKIVVKLTGRKSESFVQKYPKLSHSVSIGTTHVSGPSSSGIVQPVSHSASSNSSEELNFVADSCPDCTDV